MIEHVDEELLAVRQARLRSVMRSMDVPAILTADPINIVYGCGARNMTVFGMMGPSRFLLLVADGPAILYEFAGCEHLAAALATVDEIRSAPGITATSGPSSIETTDRFAGEIAAEIRRHVGHDGVLAVERVDFAFTDALRAAGLRLADATTVFVEARRIKQPAELKVVREAIRRVEHSVGALERAVVAGATEVEVWAQFHHDLIATGGEYVSTRLVQGGPNTFPYFCEAGDRALVDGDLLCVDTDAIGYGGYAVDLSRTFLCGPGPATPTQQVLYKRAYDQLQHNAALLSPGVRYEDIARRAWVLRDEHRPYGYYCVLHGLGLSGEHPYVPFHLPGERYPLPGELEPNMVVCVESYIGDAASGQGVKLEDQHLITDRGAERLTSYPFEDRLLIA